MLSSAQYTISFELLPLNILLGLAEGKPRRRSRVWCTGSLKAPIESFNFKLKTTASLDAFLNESIRRFSCHWEIVDVFRNKPLDAFLNRKLDDFTDFA